MPGPQKFVNNSLYGCYFMGSGRRFLIVLHTSGVFGSSYVEGCCILSLSCFVCQDLSCVANSMFC